MRVAALPRTTASAAAAPETVETAHPLSTARQLLPVILVVLAVGAIATAVGHKTNTLLAYGDSSSHLAIARRVLDSRTPSFAQLGTAWLPVPHILLMLFVYIDPLWRTGLAGSLVSVGCLCVTASCVFLMALQLTHLRVLAWIAVVALLANPDVLYVHSTALTEPVLLATMTSSAYFLLKWSNGGANQSLILAGFLAALGVLTRYEAWGFTAAAAFTVALTLQLQKPDLERTEGTVLAFVAPATYAAGLWLFYNWMIFGDPLAFQHSQYSAQADAIRTGMRTGSNIMLAFKTYSWAVIDTFGWPIVAAALLGFALYVLATRLRAKSLSTYALPAVFGFEVLLLFLGQDVMVTPQSNPPGLSDIRYALDVAPSLALFVAYLGSVLARVVRPALVAIGLGALLIGHAAMSLTGLPQTVLTLEEGLRTDVTDPGTYAVAPYFRTHYDGGGILLDETRWVFITPAGIHMDQYIGTFSGQLFLNALQDPADAARWVIYRTDGARDQVAQALAGDARFHQEYQLVQTFGSIQIYRRLD